MFQNLGIAFPGLMCTMLLQKSTQVLLGSMSVLSGELSYQASRYLASVALLSLTVMMCSASVVSARSVYSTTSATVSSATVSSGTTIALVLVDFQVGSLDQFTDSLLDCLTGTLVQLAQNLLESTSNTSQLAVSMSGVSTSSSQSSLGVLQDLLQTSVNLINSSSVCNRNDTDDLVVEFESTVFTNLDHWTNLASSSSRETQLELIVLGLEGSTLLRGTTSVSTNVSNSANRSDVTSGSTNVMYSGDLDLLDTVNGLSLVFLDDSLDNLIFLLVTRVGVSDNNLLDDDLESLSSSIMAVTFQSWVLLGDLLDGVDYLLFVSSLGLFNLLDDVLNDLSTMSVSSDGLLDNFVSVSLRSVLIIVDASLESMSAQSRAEFVRIFLILESGCNWGSRVMNFILVIRSGEEIVRSNDYVVATLV